MASASATLRIGSSVPRPATGASRRTRMQIRTTLPRRALIAPDQSMVTSAWSVAVQPVGDRATSTGVQTHCLRVESDTPCTEIPGRTVPASMDGDMPARLCGSRRTPRRSTREQPHLGQRSGLFLFALVAQIVAGSAEYNEAQIDHGEGPVSIVEYLTLHPKEDGQHHEGPDQHEFTFALSAAAPVTTLTGGAGRNREAGGSSRES